MNYKSTYFWLITTTILILSLMFMTLLQIAFPHLLLERIGEFVALSISFPISLLASTALALCLLIQFAQNFYDLSPVESLILIRNIIFGLQKQKPLAPFLLVTKGQVAPETPQMKKLYVEKVGGPAFMSVTHNNVVVTQHLGKLHRILGPGFHTLKPFETVWDVVDLNSQQRTINVGFMTRDGIRVSCEATIHFRVQSGNPANATLASATAYSEEAVLKIATLKRVKRVGDAPPTIQDWTQRVSDGILDGVIRDTLATYPLDAFINPQNKSTTSPTDMTFSSWPSISISELEAVIQQAVAKAGQNIGIEVEKVQLGPVQPTDEIVYRQWLEVWQAGLQRIVEERAIDNEARYTELILKARTEMKADLITSVLDEVQQLSQQEAGRIPGELILRGFQEATRSLMNYDHVPPRFMEQSTNSVLQTLYDIWKGPQPTEDWEAILT